jgi:hypothetical protein
MNKQLSLRDLRSMILECKRCRYTWLRRQAALPQQCPACTSQYWTSERVLDLPDERKAEVRVENAISQKVAAKRRAARRARKRQQPLRGSGGHGQSRGPVRKNPAGGAKRAGKAGAKTR